MRFSYIDSQGKEIEVDSVESLALRIELGAIEPETRMYDAVADRWAPASEHPVFRSLSRGEEITEEDVVHIGSEESAEAEAPEEGAEAEDPEEGGEEAAAGTDRDEEPAGVPDAEEPVPGSDEEEASPAADGEEPAPASDDPLGLDFQVSMAADEEEVPEAGEVESEPAASESEPPAPESEAPASGPDPEAGAEEASDEDAFDFGGFDADALEVEEPEEPEDADVPEATGPEDADLVDEPDQEAGEAPVWATGEGASLWEDDDGEEPAATGEPEPAAPEPPASAEDDDDEELPPWAREAPAWADEEADPEADSGAPKRDERVAAGGTEPGREPEAESREAARGREASVRPAHWDDRARAQERKRKLRRVAGTVALVGGLALLGAYVAGFGGFEGVLGPGPEEVAEEPAIPALPPDLRSALNAAGDRAWSAAVDQAVSEQEIAALPAEPPAEWLQGIYLSTAGDYPRVEAYWRAVGDAVRSIRARTRAAFPDELRQATGAEVEDEAEAERLARVGMEEFELSAPRREEVVQGVLTVSEASLELHRLLVRREEEIAYEPYSAPGVSRDPVLEAVAETEELREEMNAGLDRVLAAIADSGIPRPITTRSTIAHLEQRLREVGWRYQPPPGEGG